MNETQEIPAATLLALLRNKHEHVVVFEEGLCSAGVATECGEAGVVNESGRLHIAGLESMEDCMSYSSSNVTALFMTKGRRSMNQLSCLNMVESKLFCRLRIIISSADNKFLSLLLI